MPKTQQSSNSARKYCTSFNLIVKFQLFFCVHLLQFESHRLFAAVYVYMYINIDKIKSSWWTCANKRLQFTNQKRKKEMEREEELFFIWFWPYWLQHLKMCRFSINPSSSHRLPWLIDIHAFDILFSLCVLTVFFALQK